MDSSALRTCPVCWEEKPADGFLDWEGASICFECGVTAEGASLDELGERIRFRCAGRGIARVSAGHLAAHRPASSTTFAVASSARNTRRARVAIV
jgi:hypothetical protein